MTQWHNRFRSPYVGTNSLDSSGRTEETTDATIYAGLRLWRGTEVWLNPELDQGFGLSNTVGVAGFPSAEAYKIGANAPYLRLPRAFLPQTITLDGAPGPVESSANQLAGTIPSQRVIVTVGKFSATDIFDANSYAHDPRADFFNWSVIDAGPFESTHTLTVGLWRESKHHRQALSAEWLHMYGPDGGGARLQVLCCHVSRPRFEICPPECL